MKNPLITMSAIVGRPDRNDIYSYLSSLKENGVVLYEYKEYGICYFGNEITDKTDAYLSLIKKSLPLNCNPLGANCVLISTIL